MKKVLVIGDSCQDIFRYGRCEKLSSEAPVPIFNPTRTTGNGGMAINIMENLKALGIDCDIITNNLRPVKTRYVDEVSNQMLLRVDENDEIGEFTVSDFNKIDFGKYDVIVISDYNKGYLTEEIIEFFTNRHNCIFLDTKKKIGKWAFGVEFIKINEKKFNENSEFLLKEYNGELIVTIGKEGAMHWVSRYPIEEEHEVRDLSGAGDTFLAALVAEYMKNNDIREAIKFANKCAAWSVTQKGVVVINLNKMKL